MQNTPSYKEDHSSQIPALQLLQNLGYTYLTPDEALRSRGGKLSNVLLENILEKQLRKLNSIHFKGKTVPFSDANIANAIHKLKDFPLVEGLLRTSQQVFNLLTLGASFPQNIDGDEKSFSLRYIDWKEPKNNVYHVTEEFSVERTGSQDTYRPDIVLFVNGIPLVVIECKRADLKTKAEGGPLGEAISQQIRNQKADGIPHLFIYSQLLVGICTNAGKYATTGSAVKFWFKWQEKFESVTEEQRHAQRLDGLKNTPLTPVQKEVLFSDRFKYVRAYFDALDKTPRAVTEQDRLLFALCRRERLLELTYRYIVFDAGIKKIAQYQQYFAVKKAMRRIGNYIENRRGGGVIWHTQGSGKSLTMVMLAKAIALEKAIREPRIVLVTDRVDLDKQIRDTFAACDAEVVQAQTGNHLVQLITDNRSKIITTIVNKFSQAFQRGVRNESREIFALVDESHRSHYGQFNINMQRVFPNACYIGFTGTPLLKQDKSTAERFGGIIDAYPMEQAVADEAVLPLLYEGRLVVQDVNETSIDAFFDLISADLTEAQKADLKRKFSRADQLNEAEQKILRTCWDISLHYSNEWKGTGFKGQLATPSKSAALKYKHYLDQIGKVSSEVLISPPDTREGHEDVYEDVSDDVQRFWKRMMEKYGNYSGIRKIG